MKRFLAAVLSMLVPGVSCMAAASSSVPGSIPAKASRGELAARPAAGGDRHGRPGLHELALENAEPALLYVPANQPPDHPMPLVVMLHGAGGLPSQSLELVREHADRLGFIVLAPRSRARTWDIMAGRSFGPDVSALDQALAQVFERYSVDPQRVAIAGFSDGASYALSLGVANGELFRFVMAFSPGFMAPGRQQGEPRVFVSHGVDDRVLPIERCSRRIIAQLRSAGYQVDYREFPGGHIVPEEVARAAFEPLG